MNDIQVDKEYWIKIAERLNKCSDFETFFCEVSRCKMKMNVEQLTLFQKMLTAYDGKYSHAAIVHLIDILDVEEFLPYRHQKQYTEREMKNIIIGNFSAVFPNYALKQTEYKVDKIGSIDILAQDNNQTPVIIEVKTKNRTPNTQLRAYASAYKFNNPILIGITELPLSDLQKDIGIRYYIFSDLLDIIKNTGGK